VGFKNKSLTVEKMNNILAASKVTAAGSELLCSRTLQSSQSGVNIVTGGGDDG